MSHEIDMDRYLSLPTPVRVEFDGWLATEGLADKNVTWLRLHEGAVEVDQLEFDENRRPVLSRATHRIGTPPPRSALR